LSRNTQIQIVKKSLVAHLPSSKNSALASSQGGKEA
jgi:hypothetical protein